jgi:hypothetical protein
MTSSKLLAERWELVREWERELVREWEREMVREWER